MPTIEETIDITAPPSTVSDVLLDIDAAPLWTSGLERLEVVDGVAGEPGCVGHAHYVEGSRRYVLEDHLIEAVPGERFKSEVHGGGLSATIETTLTETPTGTRMTIRWVGRGTNPLTGLMLPLMRRQVSRRTREDLEALRRIAENRARSGEGLSSRSG